MSATDKLSGLLAVPFDLLECSWPQPVDLAGGRWLSPPAWQAPLMPYHPQPRWDLMEHMPVWTIAGRPFVTCSSHGGFGKMPGRCEGFRSPSGSSCEALATLRSGQRMAASSVGRCCPDRRSCRPWIGPPCRGRDGGRHARHRPVPVDRQLVVGAGFVPPTVSAEDALDMLTPFLNPITTRLQSAAGPAIKMFTDGQHPYRAVVAAYSMIVNGYAPSSLLLYGDYQWSAGARACFEQLLPFATIVPTVDVCDRLERLGGADLATLALRYWYVMKACVMVLEEPDEFCAMDDDVFVLDDVGDAVQAFRTHDYVFPPEDDFADEYHRLWSRVIPRPWPIGTGRANIGVSWQRQRHDRKSVAEAIVEVSPDRARAAGEFSDGRSGVGSRG